MEIRAGEREDLIEAGETVERALRASGLFRQVGMEQMEALFPELMEHIVGHLPLFFDGGQLEKEVAPLLATDRVRRVVEENLKVLQGLEGLGQAGLIARDPLGLRNLVLERISRLAPARGVRFQGGKLLSPDERHLLVVAELKGEATDAASSRAIPPLIRDIERQLEQRAGESVRWTLRLPGLADPDGRPWAAGQWIRLRGPDLSEDVLVEEVSASVSDSGTSVSLTCGYALRQGKRPKTQVNRVQRMLDVGL